MREIGSEFWDVPMCKSTTNIFPPNVQWFLSGRSALKSIIRELKGYHTVALPDWCCDSLIKPFVESGFSISFYPVRAGKRELDIEGFLDNDVILIMDFFGYGFNRLDLADFKGIVIRDLTHSIFTKSNKDDAHYYFGSLRKWCGVRTGGYGWTGDNHRLESIPCDEYYYNLRNNAMKKKEEYIGGKGEKTYLSDFALAEEYLENADIQTGDSRDVKLIHYLDISSIFDTRRRNAEVLRNAFCDWLVFSEMKDEDCPMFVPVVVPEGKRDDLRKHLIDKEIYCPIHWPLSSYHRLEDKCLDFYNSELSLVCDQRYTEEDMKRMAEIINSYMEGKK